MPEFKIGNDALKRAARFRIISSGAVLFLVAGAIFLLVLRASGHIGDGSDLGSLFVLMILSAAITAIILALREGLHRAERKMAFILDGNGIVRKRQGYPDVGILFSEIETAREELRWLVITSSRSYRKIAVPKNVKGYEAIRAEIAKHHAISPRASFPFAGTTWLAVSIVSWTILLWSRNERIALSAGVIGLATLVYGSRRLWILLHRRGARLLLWTTLSFTWLAALVLIYLLVARRF